jgi:antitoxin YefM
MYNNPVLLGKRRMAIHTTYSRARQNLSKLLDEVTKNQETVVIKRRRGASVVMMSEADAASLIETAYLLRSPRNAKRLLGALGRALKGESGVRMSVEAIEGLRDEVSGGWEKT